MYDVLKLLSALLVIFIIGKSVLIFITQNKTKYSLPEQIALSFGLGTGTLSIGMFLISYVGIQLNMFNIMVGFVPFFVYFFWQGFRIDSFIPNGSKLKHFNSLDIILFISIVLIFLLIATDALIQPMIHYDDRAFWALKAKILYHEGTINSMDFFDPYRIHPNQNYPLLIPLIESWIYAVLGHIDDRLVKIIFPLFFGSLLLILYSSQRQFSFRTHSLMFTALYASIPYIVVRILPVPDGATGASSGYADVPLSFFYFISTIYLYGWMTNTKNNDSLIISSIFSIFLIFTKQEGIFLFTSNLLILILFIFFDVENKLKPRTIALLTYSLLPLIILLPWFMFQQNLPNNLQFQFSFETITQNFRRAPVILLQFSKMFLNLMYWNVLWILAGVTTIFTIKHTFRIPLVYLFLMLTLHLFAYVFMYIFTPLDFESHMSVSLNRMLIHIAPAIVFLISTQISVADLLPKVKFEYTNMK